MHIQTHVPYVEQLNYCSNDYMNLFDVVRNSYYARMYMYI